MPLSLYFFSFAKCSSTVLRICIFITSSMTAPALSPAKIVLPFESSILFSETSIVFIIYPCLYISRLFDKSNKSSPTLAVIDFRSTPFFELISIFIFADVLVFDAPVFSRPRYASLKSFSVTTESTSICFTNPRSYALTGSSEYIIL